MVTKEVIDKLIEKQVSKVCIIEKGVEKCESLSGYLFSDKGDVFRGGKYIGNIDVNDVDIQGMTMREILDLLEETK